MKLSEAYSILDLPQNSSEEEVKKKYKSLTKKFHPDVNKEPGAEDKFKKINEAYAKIKSGEPDEPQFVNNGFYDTNIDLGELFGFGRTQNRQQQKIRNEPNILLTTDISFKDSIYGCKKELSFDRKIACRACDGHCVLIDSEKACKKCHGTGQTVSRNGNSIITQTCSSCRGARHTIPCTSCGGVGYSLNTTSVSVSIPPGVINNNVLKLQGMGNFCGIRNLFGGAAMQAHTDTLLTIKVEPNDKFKIEGNDIVCVENITLLDAIKGKTIPVATLDGDEQITIKPLSKNKDEIVLSRKGLGRVGNQRIVLNIDYPENINDIINILEKKNASSTDMC